MAGSARQRRILVAEYEEASQAEMQRALERAGHLVRLASSGQEALWAYRIFGPDLLVLGPSLSGNVAARVARVLEALAEVNPELKRPRLLRLERPAPTSELVERVEALLSPAV